jgi:hypothetical protein
LNFGSSLKFFSETGPQLKKKIIGIFLGVKGYKLGGGQIEFKIMADGDENLGIQ